MENSLQPWVSRSFLQNNNHQAVKKMEWIENRKYEKIQTKNRWDFVYVWLCVNDSPLAKIFNKNNIKVSYSCTNNMAQIIKKYNKKNISTNSTPHPSN